MEIRDYSQQANIGIKQNNWQNWLKSAVLLGTGLYMLVLLLTGNIGHYVNVANPSILWLSWLTVPLLLSLGGWSLWRTLKPAPPSATPANQSRLTTTALVICTLPLILGLLPSRPLGADAINGGVNIAPLGLTSGTSVNIAPEDRTVLDWLREFGRLGDPTVLNGETVDVIGFVYREPNMAENQFMVARFTMSCCVADAYAIGLPVIYEGAPDLAEGSWVHIQGTLQVGTFRPGDDPLPIITPTLVEPTDEPDSAYLYS
ncbi:MAG: TIGR03943 family protein [Anaerolineaceae bacterium]|nr:TIGR03943 family protein [Anaerolineaceae bacterium]